MVSDTLAEICISHPLPSGLNCPGVELLENAVKLIAGFGYIATLCVSVLLPAMGAPGFYLVDYGWHLFLSYRWGELPLAG